MLMKSSHVKLLLVTKWTVTIVPIATITAVDATTWDCSTSPILDAGFRNGFGVFSAISLEKGTKNGGEYQMRRSGLDTAACSRQGRDGAILGWTSSRNSPGCHADTLLDVMPIRSWTSCRYPPDRHLDEAPCGKIPTNHILSKNISRAVSGRR